MKILMNPMGWQQKFFVEKKYSWTGNNIIKLIHIYWHNSQYLTLLEWRDEILMECDRITNELA